MTTAALLPYLTDPSGTASSWSSGRWKAMSSNQYDGVRRRDLFYRHPSGLTASRTWAG